MTKDVKTVLALIRDYRIASEAFYAVSDYTCALERLRDIPPDKYDAYDKAELAYDRASKALLRFCTSDTEACRIMWDFVRSRGELMSSVMDYAQEALKKEPPLEEIRQRQAA